MINLFDPSQVITPSEHTGLSNDSLLLTMSHHVSCMSRVKHTSKWFCQVICWVDDSRKMFHSDVLVFFPSLCLDCPVGSLGLIISIADQLSSHNGVDSSIGRPIS